MMVPVEFVVIGVLVAYSAWATRERRRFRDWWIEERFGVEDISPAPRAGDDEEGEPRITSPSNSTRSRERCHQRERLI